MTPDSGKKRFVTCGTCDAVTQTSDALVELYESLGLSHEHITNLRLAFDEAVSNAVMHGHCGECERKIRIDCEWDDAAVTLVVADQGPGFDVKDVPDPTLRSNLLKESGRGLCIIRSIMSEVSFNDKGNEIRMTLKRNGGRP